MIVIKLQVKIDFLIIKENHKTSDCRTEIAEKLIEMRVREAEWTYMEYRKNKSKQKRIVSHSKT